MDSKSLATAFIDAFCQAELPVLESLLATDFRLRGPLYSFNSREAYLNALDGNLDADPQAEILSVVAERNEAAAFFRYQGNIIGQLFHCAGGKIQETLLVFDRRPPG